jgi:bifunctional non-homologous end joining protein LigD
MTVVGSEAGPGLGPEIEIDRRRLRLTNLDRVMWPRTGFTKGQMIDYYRLIGPVLVPHLAGRPVTLARLPEGIDGPGWYQTNCRGQPEWMRTVRSGRREREQNYCVIDDVPGLLWAANQGTVELHPFLARVDDIDAPLVVVFDLDPGPGTGLVECCTAAKLVREQLDAMGLTAVPKVSGSKGLHVYVPLNWPHTYAETKSFARAIAGSLVDRHPDLLVGRMARSLREGKVFLDWGQNDPGKSTVAAYSLRASPVPKASAPVGWEELERAVTTGDIEPLLFGPTETLKRVDTMGDLFRPVLDLVQRLPV